MSDSSALLDRLATKSCQLYTLPAVAMQVLDLTDDPQLDTHSLKQCIENDPALTTKILRVVNSSLFGLSRPVSDLNQALTLLGTKPLKLLVLGFSLPEGLFQDVASDVLGRYWRHTLTKAVAAREIAETLWDQPGDDAFLAGLLQDLGMLLLIQELGQSYVRFLSRVDACREDLVALEAETMGFDHTALTARLMSEWGLPEVLAKSVAWEDVRREVDSPELPAPAVPRILHLAELVARLLEGGPPELLEELLEVGQRYRDLGPAQLETLVTCLQEKVDQLAEVLRLDLPDGTDYREVLVRAHQQLARVAEDAVLDLNGQAPESPPDPDRQRLDDEMQLLSMAVAKVPGQSCSAPAEDTLPQPEPAATATLDAEPAEHRQGRESPDPGLIGQLSAVAGACRQSRCPMSLMLVELGNTDDLILAHGIDGLDRIRKGLEDACRGLDHACPICLSYREFGFAVVLPDCDRQTATRLAHQLLDNVDSVRSARSRARTHQPHYDLGVAAVSLPPKNFQPQDLLDAASRCLYGAHASGGGVVKSIEIY